MGHPEVDYMTVQTRGVVPSPLPPSLVSVVVSMVRSDLSHVCRPASALVNGATYFTDGDLPLEIPSGWQIAPDETDIRWICGHHKWRSDSLVLDDGSAIFTCRHADGSAGVAAAGLWLRARARSCE